jgi:hypothetical protein
MPEQAQSSSLDVLLCQECGGRCCQGSPGIWIDPERFFSLFFSGQRVTLEQLRESLTDLELVLWEKSGVAIPAPRSLSSGCAFLGTDGCRLPVTERPCQCLALIPERKTLELQAGCLCRLPESYDRETGRQRWQGYWQASSTICQAGDEIDFAVPSENL